MLHLYCSSNSGVELQTSELKKFASISLYSNRIWPHMNETEQFYNQKEKCILLDKEKLQKLIADLQAIEKVLE